MFIALNRFGLFKVFFLSKRLENAKQNYPIEEKEMQDLTVAIKSNVGGAKEEDEIQKQYVLGVVKLFSKTLQVIDVVTDIILLVTIYEFTQ